MSATLSRSKKRAEGMWPALKTCWPVRFSGSLGRNHEPQIGIVLGEVESLEGAFARRAAASSLGLTRYERRVLWARDIVSGVRVNRLEVLIAVVAGRRRKAMVAMADLGVKGEQR